MLLVRLAICKEYHIGKNYLVAKYEQLVLPLSLFLEFIRSLSSRLVSNIVILPHLWWCTWFGALYSYIFKIPIVYVLRQTHLARSSKHNNSRYHKLKHIRIPQSKQWNNYIFKYTLRREEKLTIAMNDKDFIYKV